MAKGKHQTLLPHLIPTAHMGLSVDIAEVGNWDSEEKSNMVFDHLENAKRYHALHPTFEAAFEFLRQKDLASLPTGRNEVDGNRLYAVVLQRQGKGKGAAQLEMHKQYIDIQFTVSGTDEIGWKTTKSCAKTGLGFDEAKDMEFFTARPDTWITTPPNTFAIFYPEDAHAPLGGEGQLHKVVMKVLLR